mmetsp:Transcript_60325/g.152746  ORF Transcript_60325/g.152746 Transcript_60325/m.152746 type:complete len:418 (-) Transcript_60325:56-1309(-)
MAEAGNDNTAATRIDLTHLGSYTTLFVAHWFGARRFDRVGLREDFHPADVKTYKAQQRDHLEKNFTRSRRTLHVSQAEASGAADADGPAAAVEGQGKDGTPQVQIVTEKQGRPWFVVVQCLVICLLYIIFALKKAGEDGMTGVDPWLAGLDSISRGSTDLRWFGPGCEDYRAEVWRWIMYQFTHIGVLHVLTNAFMLVLVGLPLEGHEGSFRVLLFFNAGVIAGALSFFVFEAHGYVVGCAGGIYALIGAHIGDLVMNWKERHFRVATAAVLLVLLSLDVLTWAIADASGGNYSFSTAFGGVVAGVIMSSVIGRNYVYTKQEKLLIAVLSFCGAVLVIFSLVWLVAHEAPVAIFESASGEGGWCWVRQFHDPSLGMGSYQCVRCKTEECVATSSQLMNLLTVKLSECTSSGYYFDER